MAVASSAANGVKSGQKQTERSPVASVQVAAFGDCLRAWRNSAGLTLEQASVRAQRVANEKNLDININRSYWHHLERDRIGRPGVKHLEAIVGVFEDLTVQDLLANRYPGEPRPGASAWFPADQVYLQVGHLVDEAQGELDRLHTTLERMTALAERTQQLQRLLVRQDVRRAIESGGSVWDNEDSIERLYDPDDVANKIEDLLLAPEEPPESDSDVLITTLGSNIFDLREDLKQFWHDTLQSALERGWPIVHVLDVPWGKSEHWGTTLLADLRAHNPSLGKYKVRIIGDTVAPEESEDVLIVPKAGAIRVHSKNTWSTDPVAPIADYAKADSQAFRRIYELYRHREQSSHDVLSIYSVFQDSYLDEVERIEQHGSGRILAMQGLSEVLTPAEVDRARAETLLRGPEKAEVRRILNLRTKKRASFERLVTRFPCRDLCSKNALIDFARDGKLPPDEVLSHRFGAPKPNPEQRRQTIANVIRLLGENESGSCYNYALGLMEGSDAAEFENGAELVKNGHAVVIECYPDRSESKLGFVVGDRAMVDRDAAKLMLKFESLPPANRERASVIDYLKNEILPMIPDE